MKSPNAAQSLYTCRFAASGARILYRGNVAVARALRGEAEVSQAIERDKARVVLAALPVPRCAPHRAWRMMRQAIAGYVLTPGARYSLLRERMGRLRDLRDPRQLTLLGD